MYAAICSQAHHDAEDILNNLLVNSLVEDNGETQRMEQEADSFSVFLVLFGLRWFVEATRSVAAWAGFPTIVSETAVSVERIDKELGLIASHLGCRRVPQELDSGIREMILDRVAGWSTGALTARYSSIAEPSPQLHRHEARKDFRRPRPEACPNRPALPRAAS